MPDDTIVIPARFCGPPDSANGGYMAGRVAEHLPDVAVPEITLRSPPPLDTPMRVEREGDELSVLHGETLVATARPGAVDVERPTAPDPWDLEHLDAPEWWAEQHPFPGCFTCGPGRPADDGLGLTPQATPGPSGRHLTRLVPPAGTVVDGELVGPVVWAALDCPSYFPFAGEAAVLGRFAVERIEPARVSDEPIAVVGWPTGTDGRKRFSASAMFVGDRLVARAQATWIVLDRPLGA